jgi:hypothetical protein
LTATLFSPEQIALSLLSRRQGDMTVLLEQEDEKGVDK